MHGASAQIVSSHTNGAHGSTSGTRRMPGYSVAEVRLAHYTWNPRRIELPHPVPYSDLVETLAKHWDAVVEPRMNSDRAQFGVRRHQDGRIVSMKQSRPHMRPGVGNRFRVHADIASFYDSIYTHSIPWALLGKQAAKTNRDAAEPANQIDRALRFARRGETTGVSIGPGTSLIVAELLLNSVDQQLKAFRYERFLDDFVAYTRDETDAEEFVRQLEFSVRQFGLNLNGRKTTIEALPLPDEPGWIRELRRSQSARPTELIDRAVDLSLNDPKASAIQWALTRIRREIGGYSSAETEVITNRLAELAYSHPHTTPVLVDVLESTGGQIAQDEIDTLLQRHARDIQSSALCWLLHLAWMTEIPISDKSWDTIAAANDPLANAYLLKLPTHSASTRRAALVTSLVEGPIDEYSKDENWPGRYIAFRDGRHDLIDPSFAELHQADVQLLADPREPLVDEVDEDPFADPEDEYFDDEDDGSWMGMGYSG